MTALEARHDYSFCTVCGMPHEKDKHTAPPIMVNSNVYPPMPKDQDITKGPTESESVKYKPRGLGNWLGTLVDAILTAILVFVLAPAAAFVASVAILGLWEAVEALARLLAASTCADPSIWCWTQGQAVLAALLTIFGVAFGGWLAVDLTKGVFNDLKTLPGMPYKIDE